jgi:large subunit ribosomal protein L13
LNIDKVILTGNKLDQKMYRYHTLHPGGFKEIQYRKLMSTRPEKAFELAVKGMLPKNSLGRAMFRKLKVYQGSEHTHQAQMPEILDI